MYYFFILIRKIDEKQFLFTWNRQQYSLTVYSLGYVHAPGFYYNRRDLDYLDIPQKIIFMQYMKDSMRVGKDGQDVASGLERLI